MYMYKHKHIFMHTYVHPYIRTTYYVHSLEILATRYA